MKTVTIYTDGACSGNPGPGGWGAILMYGPHKKEMSGGEPQTTNNRMELTGVISALRALKEPCVVELYSDSKYVIDALEKGWAKGWRARGWVKGDKKPALNPDLWQQLLELCEYHTVNLHWVKGHASNPYNNRCDELAVAQSQKFKLATWAKSKGFCDKIPLTAEDLSSRMSSQSCDREQYPPPGRKREDGRCESSEGGLGNGPLERG